MSLSIIGDGVGGGQGRGKEARWWSGETKQKKIPDPDVICVGLGPDIVCNVVGNIVNIQSQYNRRKGAGHLPASLQNTVRFRGAYTQAST